MAKIKTAQKGGDITVTRAGATKRRHAVSADGVLTCSKDEVAELLSLLPGSTLVEGSADDVDDTNVTEPPDLPKPGR